jgi:hypothetical protein
MTLLTIDEVKTFPTSELPTSEKHKDTEKKGEDTPGETKSQRGFG